MTINTLAQMLEARLASCTELVFQGLTLTLGCCSCITGLVIITNSGFFSTSDINFLRTMLTVNCIVRSVTQRTKPMRY